MSVFRVGSNKSSVNNFPSVRPTLDLDFANSKTLDPRITFTRASGGSYVGADGLIKLAGVNEARFDHNPVTGESLGLLIEESRTNLLTYSEQFDDASWVKTRASITPNSINSPNGTATADKLIEDSTATNSHEIIKGVAGLAASTTYTYSIYVKPAGRQHVALVTAGPAFATTQSVIFTLTGSGSATVTGGTPTATISQLFDGWYLCNITVVTSAGGNSTIYYYLSTGNTTAELTYTGDGTSGIYIWGAQLEQASFPTSYIPTVASTRTRAADNASITGKNFSEWYRPDEGTLFAQFKSELSITNNIWSINNYPATTFATTTNYFRLLTLSNIIHTQYNVGGTNLYPQFSLANNNSQKVTQSYNINSSPIISALNGTIGTGSGNIYATSPGFNQLEFGKNTDARTTIGQYTISRLTYYPKRLTNSQLQALTK